jgi:hypothetical protein
MMDFDITLKFDFMYARFLNVVDENKSCTVRIEDELSLSNLLKKQTTITRAIDRRTSASGSRYEATAGVICLCMLFDIEAPSLKEMILNAALALLFYVCGHGLLFESCSIEPSVRS